MTHHLVLRKLPLVFLGQLAALLWAVTAFIPPSAGAETAPEFMTKIEYSRTTGAGPVAREGSALSERSVIWMAGSSYTAHRQAPDYERGLHGLLVVREPDIWVINLLDRTGRHTVDRSRRQSVRLPLFPTSEIKPVRQLEFGSELTFFQSRNAEQSDAGTVNGVRATRYRVTVDTARLSLTFDSTHSVPLRIENDDTDEGISSIEYLSYDTRVKFDPRVFTVPAGITVTEAALTDSRGGKEIKNGWIAEFMTRYYLQPQPERIGELLTTLKEERLLDRYLLLSSFLAPVFRDNPARLGEWVKTAEPLGTDLQRFIYITLRLCGTSVCSATLKKNPYRFDTQELAAFAAFKPATVDTIPLTTPEALDFLWADFLATGSTTGVKRILALLAAKWPAFEEKKLARDELLLVGAARWSVISNAQQHGKVLDVLREESARSETLRGLLNEVAPSTPVAPPTATAG